jgi:hypothetical protein
MADETATIVQSREPLKHILRSWMVFLLRIHQKTEMIGEKVLPSVTLGEPKNQALTSFLVGAFSFE